MSHGNSNKNTKPHHLYEIRDKEEDDIFKYGISDNQIDDDGLSRRIRRQLTILNAAVGWLRFFANILKTDISGRKKAKQLEQ